MKASTIGYLAGLFDADGSISYKQYARKNSHTGKVYDRWDIAMEVAMTNKNVIKYIHETLMCGSFSKKPPSKGQLGKKMQYRWRCGHKDALAICKLFLPYSIVKLDKVKQIIKHYEK